MNGLGILILIVLGILVVVFWYLERRVGPHRGDMTIEQSMDEWDVGGSGGMYAGG